MECCDDDVVVVGEEEEEEDVSKDEGEEVDSRVDRGRKVVMEREVDSCFPSSRVVGSGVECRL